MTRAPIWNAFVMVTPNHQTHGFWNTPEGKVQEDYLNIQRWIDISKTLEEAKFDALFFADGSGVFDLHAGDGKTAARIGSVFPALDPTTVIPILAHETSDISFAFTSNIVQDQPFSFARKVSSLDHLTNGRVGWNIVTSFLTNAFRNFGHDDIESHDERYIWAQEFVDVVFKLWEGSWDDNPRLLDQESGSFFDAEKIHPINHKSSRYSVEGPHFVEPSKQQTPLLFQAGFSSAGRDFAARNAETVFLPSATPEAAAADIAAIKELAVSFGRDPDSIRTLVSFSPVWADTEEEALERQKYVRENLDLEGVKVFWSGITGVDLIDIDLETPIDQVYQQTQLGDHSRSLLHALVDGHNLLDQDLTLGDFLKDFARSSAKTAGTPTQIADEVQRWVDAGVDGFNVIPVVTLNDWHGFARDIVPVLRERGLIQEEYTEGSFRRKVFGDLDRIDKTHPAAQYRGAFKDTVPQDPSQWS